MIHKKRPILITVLLFIIGSGCAILTVPQRIDNLEGEVIELEEELLKQEINVANLKEQVSDLENSLIQDIPSDVPKSVEKIYGAIAHLDDRKSAKKRISHEARLFYAERVAVECSYHGIDPILFVSLMWEESMFRRTAVSPKDARGLCQILPRVWIKNKNREMRRAGIPTDGSITVEDLFDPTINIRLGAAILNHYIKDSNGSVRWGLAKYNGCRKRCVNSRKGYPSRIINRQNDLKKKGF